MHLSPSTALALLLALAGAPAAAADDALARRFAADVVQVADAGEVAQNRGAAALMLRLLHGCCAR